MIGTGFNLTSPPQSDVFRVVQPLVAGNNVITHNLGFSAVSINVYNDATGSIIDHRVVAESTMTTTIFVAVAVAMARISLDV